MLYITEKQLSAILNAVRQLPVKADTFDAADAWIGLYMAINKIGEQKIPEKEPEAKDEETEG